MGSPRRVCAALLLVAVLAIGPLTQPASGAVARRATPWWVTKLDSIVGDRPFSVAVGAKGEFWYRNLAAVGRPPASNEKLLLSMALFDRLPLDWTMRTRAASKAKPRNGVLRADLWLVGNGDPETDRPALARLAQRVIDSGVRKIVGSVRGGTGPFRRDWWAPGWKKYFPAIYIPLPTALTFEGNEDRAGVNISDPERRAASFLTRKLEQLGVKVTGAPSMGRQPSGLRTLGWIPSAHLADIVRRMCLRSRNFYAEVLGKRLGLLVKGEGSIAAGARQIEAFVASKHQRVIANDSSGLSYSNRVAAQTFVRLLWKADAEQWGETLRLSLPHADQGTLEDRLRGVRLHAKTGTLTDASALTGWVWAERADRWVEFSIMSSNYDDTAAKGVEDSIVRLLARYASKPGP